MSNVAIDMFGMTAVLSRATRTITKGDANADYEVSKYSTFITNTFIIYIYIYTKDRKDILKIYYIIY